MGKMLRLCLMSLVAMAVALPVLAGDAGGAGAAGGRRGMRGAGAGGNGAGGAAGAGVNARGNFADRLRQMADTRLTVSPLALLQQGRDEDQRYQTEIQPLMKDLADLRAAMKKDTDAGVKAEDALQAQLDKAKELAKKLLAAYTTHLDNISKLLKDGGDDTVAKVAEGLLKPPQNLPGMGMRPGGRGGAAGGAPAAGGDAKPAPVKDAAKPAPPADGGDNPFKE